MKMESGKGRGGHLTAANVWRHPAKQTCGHFVKSAQQIYDQLTCEEQCFIDRVVRQEKGKPAEAHRRINEQSRKEKVVTI